MEITLKADNGFEIVFHKTGRVIIRSNSLELVFSSLEDFEIWIKESYTQ